MYRIVINIKRNDFSGNDTKTYAGWIKKELYQQYFLNFSINRMLIVIHFEQSVLL
jgi:hypothetical protein